MAIYQVNTDGGGSYTTQAAAEGALPATPTEDDIVTVEGSAVDSATVTYSGYSRSTYKLDVIAVSGDEALITAIDNGRYRHTATINADVGNIHFDGIQKPPGSAAQMNIDTGDTTNRVTVKNCRIQESTTNPPSGRKGVRVQSGRCDVENCIIESLGSVKFSDGVERTGGELYVRNTLIRGWGTSVSGTLSEMTSSIMFDTNQDLFGGSFPTIFRYNAADRDISEEGQNNIQLGEVSVIFVSGAYGGDYTINNYLGEGAVKDAADPDNSTTYDIAGTLRVDPDMGPYEIPTAGPTNVVIDPALISSSGDVFGTCVISVSQAATPLQGDGSLLGAANIVVNVLEVADPITSAGSIIGGHSIVDVVLVAAGAITGTGAVSGGHVITVDQLAQAISSTGSLNGNAAVSSQILAQAITGTGLTAGVVQIGTGVIIAADLITAAASVSGSYFLSVDQLATAIAATSNVTGSSMVSVQQVADVIAATGALAGTAQVGAGVIIAADPIAGSGSLHGTHVISVEQLANIISASGTVSGDSIVSVLRAAEVLAASGSVIGGVQAGAGVIIAADPVAAVGSLSGSSVLSVLQAATPISSQGDVFGSHQIDVLRVADAIQATGLLAGTPQIGAGVNVAAGPIVGGGSVLGQHIISANIAATIITATGEVLGTVEVTEPGNIVIQASPIEASGSVSGSSIIDVLKGGLIDGAGTTDGSGNVSMLIQAAPIDSSAVIIGGQRIGVEIAGEAIQASGLITGQVLQNVLQAASAIVGSGNLLGVVQVIGPGQFGVITNPGVESVTPIYAVVSVTPRLFAVSVTPDLGVKH